jgi:acetyl-CoA acetyltransferase
MRDIAIVAFAQSRAVAATTLTPVEMIVPVVGDVLARAGLERHDVGFWCHGSCDYMVGQPFSFVSAVDALGAWPPIVESHVEMDGAWALYEAWVKMQAGECDTALVFGNGKSSAGDLHRALALQFDPYVVSPLWPDQRAIAGLQARAGIESGCFSELDMAEVAARSRRDALANPAALVSEQVTGAALLGRPVVMDPLRAHDCPAMADGVAAVVLAAGDVARSLVDRPAWIRAIHHLSDGQRLGDRPATKVPSAEVAAGRCGVGDDKVDVAELHAPFTHQELLLRDALGIDDGSTTVNPSGGALVANVVMAAGLARLGEVASRIMAGTADRGVGHATQGPWLQQNLVCVMEGD